jgi:LDH2 family malate/lactate/ureidoglycolate dehydrogenase
MSMKPPNVETIKLSDQALCDFITRILGGAGVPESHAMLVSNSLVAANLRGIDSHGLQLLSGYMQQLREGGVDGSASGVIASETSACLLYDGQNGLGQVVAHTCAHHAVRLARDNGVGLVIARNSHHFGAAFYWSEIMARAGCIGITMSTTGIVIPPWQGKSARLGTNPIAMAVPGFCRETWSLDMATTTVARNRVASSIDYGLSTIPASWRFMDENGNPTTSCRDAENGWPQPLGGYKGTGLAMMVEILCAGLSGGPMSTEAPFYRDGVVPLRTSHMFMAVDPTRFMQPGEFEKRMVRLIGLVKSSEPASGYDEVLVAGEPEWRMEKERSRDGIPIPKPLWTRIVNLARNLKVSPPKLDATGS